MKLIQDNELSQRERVLIWILVLAIFLYAAYFFALNCFSEVASGVISLMGVVLTSSFFTFPSEIKKYKQTLSLEQKHQKYCMFLTYISRVLKIIAGLQAAIQEYIEIEKGRDCQKKKCQKQILQSENQKLTIELTRLTEDINVFAIARLYLPADITSTWEDIVFFIEHSPVKSMQNDMESFVIKKENIDSFCNELKELNIKFNKLIQQMKQDLDME